MTATGMSVGSPAYMSPEQIQAAEVDGQSDQFALAVIAFQMLAGRMPFRGDTAVTLMFQIVTADPFNPQSSDLPLSPEVRAVLGRALAKKPQDRFPDCASFVQQLTDAAGAVVAVAQAEALQINRPPDPPRGESKSWMIGPILGGILTLGLLGGGIYYFLYWRCCAPKQVPVAPSAEIAESTTTPVPTAIPTLPPTPTPEATPLPTPTLAPSPTPAPANAATN